MATNRRTVKETDNEFYRTPIWGTKALLYYEKFEDEISEVCCGDGAISKVLKGAGYKVNSSDLIDRGYGKQEDFLKFEGVKKNVVTNPPYDKYALPIIEKALAVTQNKVCMLVRLAFLEGQTRFWDLYNSDPPTRVLVFSERLSMYKGDVDRTDGGTTAYQWLVWSRHKPHTGTQTVWIRPGLKEGSVKRFIYGKRRHEQLL